MCVIEYVDHHSAFTTTNAIIPRIISSSSSAHAGTRARTRARARALGLNLTTVIYSVSDKTDDNTRDVSNRTGHFITSSVIEIQHCSHDNNICMFRPMSSHLGKQAEECRVYVCVSEWIQENMIDIATSLGATDATFWKTNF